MKSLLLTVTLFVLVTILHAQDDLPFLSEDKNVRPREMVEGVGGGCLIVVQCLRIGASTHELFSSQSLVSSPAPQHGVLSALYCSAVSIAALPAGPQRWNHRRVPVAVTPRTRMFLRGGPSYPVLEPMTLGALGIDTSCLTGKGFW